MSDTPNVFADEPWEMVAEQMQVRGRSVSRPAGARELGAMVYELEPGASGFNLHAHYGIEELFVVLQGRPTLRTSDEERQLEAGDVVACPRGRDGMHTIANRSEEPALVLAVSTLSFPDVAVYPEQGTFGVVTRHPFEPLPEGGDEGIVGLFEQDSNLRRP